jgi:hypothetical protein
MQKFLMLFWIYKIPVTLLIRMPEEPISNLDQGTYHPEWILSRGFPHGIIHSLSKPFNLWHCAAIW